RPMLATAEHAAHDAALDLKRSVADQRNMSRVVFSVRDIDNRAVPLLAVGFHVEKNLPANERFRISAGGDVAAEIVPTGTDVDGCGSIGGSPFADGARKGDRGCRKCQYRNHRQWRECR